MLGNSLRLVSEDALINSHIRLCCELASLRHSTTAPTVGVDATSGAASIQLPALSDSVFCMFFFQPRSSSSTRLVAFLLALQSELPSSARSRYIFSICAGRIFLLQRWVGLGVHCRFSFFFSDLVLVYAAQFTVSVPSVATALRVVLIEPTVDFVSSLGTTSYLLSAPSRSPWRCVDIAFVHLLFSSGPSITSLNSIF